MKARSGLLATVLMAVSISVSGCSVDKVNIPPPQGSTAATVQVTLGAAAIANGGSTSVTALVTDSSGFVVPDVSVAFSAISAVAGTFNPTSATTDLNGIATSLFTAAAAGNNSTVTIRATVTVGTTTVSGSASLTIGTPPVVPTSVVVSLSTNTLPDTGGAVTVTATVTGATGPVSGSTVNFSVSDNTAGSFSAGSATTNASGVATVTFTAVSFVGSGALVQITGAVGSLNNSATLTIGNPPAPTPSSMNLSTTPLSINILGQSTITVTLLTSAGAPAFSNPVTIAITGGTTLGSLSSTTTVTTVNLTTNASGNASATFYAGTSSGVVTITATSGALSKTASINITSEPASLSLTIVNPSLVNGQNTSLIANVLNAANQPVSDGTTVTYTLVYAGSAPGSLSSATAFTVNGVASVTFTADAVNVGPVFITASAGATTPVTDTKLLTVSAAQAGSIIFVSAEPQIIGIYQSGTQDTAVVTFQVLNSVGAPLANQSVDFSMVIGPTGATLDTTGGSTSSGSTGADGKVSTILHAGTVAGPVRIVATTTAPGPPAVTLSTSSGNISIGGGVPSDKWLSVSASKLNIDGWTCDGVETTINAMLADRFSNYNILQGTSVSFAAEGGAIDASNVTNANGFATSVFRSQDPRPTDGRVSVLVHTTGEEDFFDSNANGVYDDPAEQASITDLPEPFIDSDESDARDAGELYFDWPSTVTSSTTGTYNYANGVWDSKIPIFRNITILLTGPPVGGALFSRITNTSGGTGNITIGNGGSEVFRIFVSDINFNPPIAGTTIAVTADKGTLSTTSYTVPDSNSAGPHWIDVRLKTDACATGPGTCPAETVSLDAEITWNGKCGGTFTLPLFYPGTITLTYL